MIHAFGCSFTRYQWPTWADLLNQIEPCVNYGSPGTGNKAIYTRMANALFTGKITQGVDRVTIQWTGHTRYDLWLGPKQWQQLGNVWNQTGDSPVTSAFLQHLWSDQDALIQTLILVQSAALLLNYHKIAYHFVFMNNLRSFTLETGNHSLGPYPDLLDPHWQNFDKLNRSELSMTDWVKQSRKTRKPCLWQWDKHRPASDDLHPEPWEAYTYAKKELGSVLRWQPEQWQQLATIAEQCQQELREYNAENPQCLMYVNKNNLNYYPGAPIYKEGHIKYLRDQELI